MMAPRRRAVVLVAAVALAVIGAAAWLAPAALLDSRVARASGDAVRLAAAEGTVWRGRGTIVAATARIPIAWDVDIWPLLGGVVRVQVRSGNGAATPRATIALRGNTVALHDVDVTLPAAVVAAFMGYAAASVTGEVGALAGDFEAAPGSYRGEARLVWRGARIVGIGDVGPLDLGEVRGTAKADGDAVSGPLANEGGDLALRGQWTMTARDGLALALLLTPTRADQKELMRTLSAIGTPEGGGWRVDWRAPLR
jgi:hypothetical protein